MCGPCGATDPPDRAHVEEAWHGGPGAGVRLPPPRTSRGSYFTPPLCSKVRPAGGAGVGAGGDKGRARPGERKPGLLERVRLPNARPSISVARRSLPSGNPGGGNPGNADGIEESPSKDPKPAGFSNRERFRTAFRMKAYALRQSSEDGVALADPSLEERGFPPDVLMEDMIPTLKLVIRAVRIMRFLLNKKRFKETLRPYDVKDVIEQYSAGHLDMLCRIKYLQTRIDLILAPGALLTPKHKKNQKPPFSFPPNQSPRHDSYLAKEQEPEDQSMMGRFTRVERQVEDMEKKLDFLVDMHIQHSEHLLVDSAGSARMTLDPCVVAAGTMRGPAFYGLSDAFPAPPPHGGRPAYRFPVGKVNPYLLAFHKEGGAAVGAGGAEGGGGGGGLPRGVGEEGLPPPLRRPAASPVPTYTERPTVLPISSLQPPATSPALLEQLGAWPDRTPGGGVNRGGGGGGDTPLSMLSVNHEELERSLSGFSISVEREEEEEEEEEEGGGVGGRRQGGAGGRSYGGRSRPSYLAEAETDTDSDPFTPSGAGPLPLSSTGEGLADAVWNSPP
ncbi:unnamed protein product [Lota lota]